MLASMKNITTDDNLETIIEKSNCGHTDYCISMYPCLLVVHTDNLAEGEEYAAKIGAACNNNSSCTSEPCVWNQERYNIMI